MENEIQYIEEQLQLQENKYYEKVRSLIDFAALTEEQKIRTNEELELIHLSGSSKKLYMAYCIAKRLREDNKSYHVRGGADDSFVCYLLGITKVSPYDPRLAYVLPYQPFLGITEKPKHLVIEFDIHHIPRDVLLDDLKEKFKEDTEFLTDIDSAGKEINVHITFSIKGFSETKLFAEHSDNGRLKYFDFSWKYDKYATVIVVVETAICTVNSLMREYTASLADKEAGFKLLSQDKQYQAIFNKDNTMIGTDDYWLYCLGAAEPHNTVSEGAERIMICREDIWMRLQKLNMDEQTRYDIFDKIRRGKTDIYADSWMPLFEEAGETDFLNIMKGYIYLFPVAHIIEVIEAQIEYIWYKHNYPIEFEYALYDLYHGFRFNSINTGYSEVDDLIGGIPLKSLTIIVGGAETGKTTFALHTAVTLAKGYTRNVAIFSLAEPERIVNAWTLGMLTGIDRNRILHPELLTDSEKDRIENEINNGHVFKNIIVIDNDFLSVEDICNKARKIAEEAYFGLDAIIIDYLQLVGTCDEYGHWSSPHDPFEISSIVKKLNALSRELNIAVILLTQRHRRYKDKNPSLKEFRNYIGLPIQYNTDFLIFITNDDSSESEEKMTKVIVAKNGRGQTGEVNINLLGRSTCNE